MIDFSDDVAFNEFLEERIRVGHKFVALILKKDTFLSSNKNSTLIRFLSVSYTHLTLPTNREV